MAATASARVEALIGEVAFKATASLFSGLIGILVLAGSWRRSANVFLASFMLLLAGNQFAETMRLFATTLSEELFWLRIASIFAFLDPLALYAFGAVYPERNRLAHPPYLAAVTIFTVALTACVPFVLNHDWRSLSGSGLLMALWLIGTVVIYGAVLGHAIRQSGEGDSRSSAAPLVPALAVLTIPAVFRATHYLWAIVNGSGKPILFAEIRVRNVVGLAAVLLVAGYVLAAGRNRSRLPASSARFLTVAAVTGFFFALVDNPQVVLRVWASAVEPLSSGGLRRTLVGVGGTVKLLTFGVLSSAAILRRNMLDLSLRTRRWAARVLSASIVLVGALALAGGVSYLFGESLLGDPLIFVLAALFLATEGFRRLVDAVAESVYRVPRDEKRLGRIEAYRDAVAQAKEEGRSIGADTGLERLRQELGLDEETAHVVERMETGMSKGPLVPGERLEGRYLIEEFLGRGSGGRVFHARDELLERDVVIKEVLDGGPHETAVALREARTAGQLSHPNVVTVHDVLKRPGASLLITEYAEGGSLATLRDEAGPLPPARVLELLDGVLSGLEAVHAKDIVHGDLKPSNILLDEKGIPKIADFGSSRVMDSGTWSEGGRRQAGTPNYMAPEVRSGEQPSVQSDVYSVAVLSEELAREPFADGIQDVLDRAKARSPEDRWASVTELRQALRAHTADATFGR